MWWYLIVVLGSSSALCSGTTSNRTISVDVSGGVCKADYNSRYNIEPKELGTTCEMKSRGLNGILQVNHRPLVVRIRQALDRMRQDFDTLQSIIDNNHLANHPESIWKGNSGVSLSVNRDYSESGNISPSKVQVAVSHSDKTKMAEDSAILTKDARGVQSFNSETTKFGDQGLRNGEEFAQESRHDGSLIRSQANQNPAIKNQADGNLDLNKQSDRNYAVNKKVDDNLAINKLADGNLAFKDEANGNLALNEQAEGNLAFRNAALDETQFKRDMFKNPAGNINGGSPIGTFSEINSQVGMNQGMMHQGLRDEPIMAEYVEPKLADQSAPPVFSPPGSIDLNPPNFNY